MEISNSYLEWRIQHDVIANFHPGQSVRIIVIPPDYVRILVRGQKIIYLYGQPPNKFYKMLDSYLSDINKAIRQLKDGQRLEIMMTDRFLKIIALTDLQFEAMSNCSVINGNVDCPSIYRDIVTPEMKDLMLFEKQYWDDVREGRPTNRK